MGLTPTPPNLGMVAKDFWDRPEGKLGKIVLLAAGAGAIGLGVFFWGLILPFLIGVAGNTVQLAMLVAVLAVVTSPIWSSNVRMVTRLAFENVMRRTVGIFVENDPVGILKTNIVHMKDQVQEFDKALELVSSAKQRLSDDIAEQRSGFEHDKDLVDSIKSQIAKGKQAYELAKTANDKQEIRLKIDGLNMQMQNIAQGAGYKLDTIKTETPLYQTADKMYEQLTRIRTLAAFKVQGMEQRAGMLAKRREMVLAARKGLSAGSKILRGNPAELAVIDQAVEFLNNEASDTLGAMNDFSRWSEGYLTNMDIQNEASSMEAMKMFEKMEDKLKLPEQVESQPLPDFDSPEIQKLLK